ncbi:MAG: hypothetical protein K0S08_1402 [Gammaproteobacteria bacterium]|jgi:hypothetical protein|nr:hypothetical protein [Gammaproteobacteria bacterium]
MRIFILSACLCLAGCVTGGYQEPTTSSASQPLATIKNYADNSITHPKYAFVESIDGQRRIYNTLFESAPSQSTKVKAGEHDFVITNTFNPGFLSFPRTSTAELNIDLKPGINYQLQMSVEGAHTLTWLTDEQGNTISQVVKAPYKVTPGSGVIVVPVAR